MYKLKVNKKEYNVDASPDMPLLWVLRDLRSCVTLMSRAAGKDITTIEGLSATSTHPLQVAWLQEDTPQCGYCQSGQIMSAAVLLRENPNPTDQDIDHAMSGNICRCGTYPRIKKAIHLAAQLQKKGGKI